MSDSKPFSERLLWARSEAGLTQKELAEKSKVSLPQIVRYEAGRAKPRLRGAMQLARALNIDLYELDPDRKNKHKEIAMSFSGEDLERLERLAKGMGVSVDEFVELCLSSAMRKLRTDPEFRAQVLGTSEDLPELQAPDE